MMMTADLPVHTEMAEEPKKNFVSERDPLTVLHKLSDEFQARVKMLPADQQSAAADVELTRLHNTLTENYRAEVLKKSTLAQRVDAVMLHIDMMAAEA